MKDNYNIGERIKIYRKMNRYSLQEFGEMIGKTKSTVCRYESNEIIPDFQTVLEMCEALKVDVYEFLEVEKKNKNNYAINPFKTNELYLYYIGFNKKIVESKLEISEIGNEFKVLFKNAINKNQKDNSYMYSGIIESDNIVTFINLTNGGTNSKFEKIQITINNQFEQNECYYGSISATGNDNLPTVRKCMISKESIDSFSKDNKKKVFESLKFNKKELDGIKKNGFWNVEVRNEEDYFIDINKG